MAAALDIVPTVNYLTDAAHLLRTVAPESAAHLMSTRQHVMYHHDLAVSDVQRQHVCFACGNIMIPGDESTCRIQGRRAQSRSRQTTYGGQRAKRRQPSSQGSTRYKVKTISCGRCQRLTKIPIDTWTPTARPKQGRGNKAKSQVQMQDSNRSQRPNTVKETQPVEDPKPSANANSKKRAKNRKAGLQALLAGQQQKSNPLSLADFRKK